MVRLCVCCSSFWAQKSPLSRAVVRTWPLQATIVCKVLGQTVQRPVAGGFHRTFPSFSPEREPLSWLSGLNHLQFHHLRRDSVVDQFLLEPYSGGVTLEALKKDAISSLPANLKPIGFLFAGLACAFIGQDGYLHSFHSSMVEKRTRALSLPGVKALKPTWSLWAGWFVRRHAWVTPRCTGCRSDWPTRPLPCHLQLRTASTC